MNKIPALESPKGVVEKRVVITLTTEQYNRIADKFTARLTDNPTLAAVYLGQQMVLQELRQGFVVAS